MIIRSFVKDYDDAVLDLALKLHEIVERLCAQEFFLYEVKILEEMIVFFKPTEIREQFFLVYIFLNIISFIF